MYVSGMFDHSGIVMSQQLIRHATQDSEKGIY